MVRMGLGYDVHSFDDPGGVTHIRLGGVDIEYHQKLKGHSDADVVLHAITDAIFGAIADGDIGQHFPPSDEKWRGASSDLFLNHAAKRLVEKGGSLNNIDVTIICEVPKIGPHREAMRQRIADILDISIDQVSVKATTTEKLGFTGRKEGIACQAIACVTV